MTAPDLFRVHDRGYLPGHHPDLDGPGRNGRDWLAEERDDEDGLYPYGKSDPRYWPRGIRQVTGQVTADDIAAGKRGGPHPVAAAVRRALRLPGDAAVTVYCDWFSIRSGEVCEWHDLPCPAGAFTRAAGEFTFTTAEDWQSASEEES